MKAQDIKHNLEIAKRISDKIAEIKKSLPYHLNIIDELHINENAHSRILSKLLLYEEDGRYIFLEKFFEYCDVPLKPEKPEITTEKHRIDILIMDKASDYAVIIENKVNYAGDQSEQIKRYFEKVKQNGIVPENIYVFYLTRWGHKTVSKDSLPDELKKQLADKYIPINFNRQILPWLNTLTGFCRYKDTQLIAAIHQYTDFIIGLLNQRNDTKKIYNIMKKEIEKILELQDKNNIEKYQIINKKFEEITNLQGYLDSMKNELANNARKAFIKKLYNKLNEHYPDWEYRSAVINKISLFDDEAFDRPYFGMAYTRQVKKIDDKELVLSIELQNDKGNWKSFLCGVFIYGEQPIREKIEKFFDDAGLIKESVGYWVYLHRSSYVFDDTNIGYNVNDPKWDQYFIEKTDEVVDVFYNQVVRVLEAWQKYVKEQE